jgi:hypothetical protein
MAKTSMAFASVLFNSGRMLICATNFLSSNCGICPTVRFCGAEQKWFAVC